MTPLKPIGVDVEIKSGIGPVISNPIKSVQDVEKLSQIDPKKRCTLCFRNNQIAYRGKIKCTVDWFYRCAVHISILYD